MHYQADADIRECDDRYAERQGQDLRAYAAKLPASSVRPLPEGAPAAQAEIVRAAHADAEGAMRQLRVVVAVVGFAIIFAIAAVRGGGVVYALWIGFRYSPLSWWVKVPAIIALLLGVVYLFEEWRIRDRWRSGR